MEFKVYSGQVPLTVGIKDEKRAALAYNVLHSMADNGAKLKLDDISVSLFAKDLRVVDDTGKSFIPELDHEWNGTEEQRFGWNDEQVKTAIEDARKNGEEIDETAAMRRIFTESYSPVLDDGLNNLYFMGETHDLDKAVEVFNFLQCGIDPSISILIKDVDEDKMKFLAKFGEVKEEDYTSYLDLVPDNIFLIDQYNNVMFPETDTKWADMMMDQKTDEDGMDFADAIASLSEQTAGLEQ